MFRNKPFTKPLLIPTQAQIDAYEDIKANLVNLTSHYVPSSNVVFAAGATLMFAINALFAGLKTMKCNAVIESDAQVRMDTIEKQWINTPAREGTGQETTCGESWSSLSKITDNCRFTVSPEREKYLTEVNQGMRACYHLAYQYCATKNESESTVLKNNFMFAFCLLVTAVSLGITLTLVYQRHQENKKINKQSVSNVLSITEQMQFKQLIIDANLNLNENSALGDAIATLQQIKYSIENNRTAEISTSIRPGLIN